MTDEPAPAAEPAEPAEPAAHESPARAGPEPAAREPAGHEPAAHARAGPEPAAREPAAHESPARAGPEPAAREPAGHEPAAHARAGPEPAAREPAAHESPARAGPEPAAREPAGHEPPARAGPEPAAREPAGHEPPARAGPEPAAHEPAPAARAGPEPAARAAHEPAARAGPEPAAHEPAGREPPARAGPEPAAHEPAAHEPPARAGHEPHARAGHEPPARAGPEPAARAAHEPAGPEPAAHARASPEPAAHEPPSGEPAAPGTPAPGGADAERPVAVALVVATLAAGGLAGVYVAGGQPQAEGALLFASLAGIGVALALWAKRLLPEGEVTEPRGDLPSSEEDRAAFDAALDTGESFFTRRRRLLRLLGAAGGALGVALIFPIRSLGPSPGRSLSRTAWGPDVRLVDEEGEPVRVTTLQVGSVLTVFPEGRAQAGDSQTVLIRTPPGALRPRPGRESWSPEGYVAYSKICPHVGCPVALYQEDTQELLCPCHQSTFDVLDGARPTFGPATRPLPQLPIYVDRDGFLRAQADFPEPVGPGYWNRR